MFDPTTVGKWIGVVVAAATAFAGFVKFVFWAFDEWRKRKEHDGFSAPVGETLRFASKPEGNCWWHMGRRGDEQTMQIAGSLFATNVASISVRIPQIQLRYGLWGRKRVSGMVLVSGGPRENTYGMYDIPPSETRNVNFDFWVYPPVKEPIEHFTPHSVVFMDQFGNRHVIKRLQFRSEVADNPPKPNEPEEFPYAITDPIEKEIVSVLKAEIGRYEMHGRRVGGLGSLYIVYKDRPVASFGGDSWTPDSHFNQLIIPDPDPALLKSDNLEALVGFYRHLDSDEERARFKAVLLDPLDANRGYLKISYFIVCVLMCIGALADALQKARRDLPSEKRVFGLSNILMLLNGLLKYRHLDFTSQMLDEIERMIHGLGEHPFMIPGKIAAIRARRLSAADPLDRVPTLTDYTERKLVN
jgi:hypothetical protein